MATPPAQPTETSAAASATVDSLKDDNIEDILLQLPSPASLARTALSSRRWRRVASSPDFLRRFRERHPSPPVLGLFVSQTDLGQLPVFHPSASVRSDPDLAAAARGGDFLLTRLEHDLGWRLRDCRNGRLLLCRGESLSIYNPISHLHVAVRRPPTEPLPLLVGHPRFKHMLAEMRRSNRSRRLLLVGSGRARRKHRVVKKRRSYVSPQPL